MCVRKEKDVDRVNCHGYPGYPAEPRPPPAPSLRMTRRQQSQLETHAVHHTQTKTVCPLCLRRLIVPTDYSKQQTLLSCWFIFFSPLLVFPVSASWSLTWCFPTLASEKPGWLTWSGPSSAISTLPSLSVYLPMAVIFNPLSSGSKYRSSSGPISISRGPQQRIWEGKHWNPIAQLDTLLTTGSDWHRL